MLIYCILREWRKFFVNIQFRIGLLQKRSVITHTHSERRHSPNWKRNGYSDECYSLCTKPAHQLRKTCCFGTELNAPETPDKSLKPQNYFRLNRNYSTWISINLSLEIRIWIWYRLIRLTVLIMYSRTTIARTRIDIAYDTKCKFSYDVHLRHDVDQMGSHLHGIIYRYAWE